MLQMQKKLIGGRFVDVSVQSGIRLWPFKVISGPTDKLMIVVNYDGGEKPFTAKKNPFCKDAWDCRGWPLRHCEERCGRSPCYFSHSQRLAAKQAGALAGLNTLRIIDEHVCNPVLAEIYLAVCAVGNDVNLSSEWQWYQRNILANHLRY